MAELPIAASCGGDGEEDRRSRRLTSWRIIHDQRHRLYRKLVRRIGHSPLGQHPLAKQAKKSRTQH